MGSPDLLAELQRRLTVYLAATAAPVGAIMVNRHGMRRASWSTMMKRLSGELIAILAVGATVVGVTLAGHAGFHARMDRMEARIDARIDDLGAQLTTRIDDLDARSTGRIDDLEGRLISVEEKVTRLDALDIGHSPASARGRTGGPARERGPHRGTW